MILNWLHPLHAQVREFVSRRSRRARRRNSTYLARSSKYMGRSAPCVRGSLEQLEDRCLLSTMTVDGSQHFQTIDGFGTNLSSEAWNNGAVTPSLDLLLSQGYKLYRVLVEPVQGWEDTNPNTGPYSTSNPNWPFYNNLYGTSTKFTNLWNTISYLNNHGATVWVNLPERRAGVDDGQRRRHRLDGNLSRGRLGHHGFHHGELRRQYRARPN